MGKKILICFRELSALLCVIFLITLQGDYAAAEDEYWELKLYNDKMSNYSKYIKPSRDPNKQIMVFMSFSLSRMESLDEKNQVLTCFGWLSAMWEDELLKWNPLEYGHTYRMVLPASQVWMPEIAMLNSVEQGNDLTLDSDFRVAVTPHGIIQWTPGFKWVTSCKVDLFYFPFDRQECEVQFVNWMYGSLSVNLTYSNPEVDTTYMTPNGEWDIYKTKVDRTDLTYNDPSGIVVFHLPMIAFRLYMKRYPSFLVINVIIPAIIMTLMTLLVFLLPAEAGEKLSLGITVLLSYSVVLLMISDITPRISVTLPLISLYIVISMALTAVSLLCTVIVLRIHHHSPEKPLPHWARKLVLQTIAYFLCMRRSRDVPKRVQPSGGQGIINVQPCADNEKPPNDPSADFGAKCMRNDKVGQVIPGDVLSYVHLMREKMKATETYEKNKEDWEATARVIDRLFLAIFSVVIVVTSAVVFGLLQSQIMDSKHSEAIRIVND